MEANLTLFRHVKHLLDECSRRHSLNFQNISLRNSLLESITVILVDDQ